MGEPVSQVFVVIWEVEVAQSQVFVEMVEVAWWKDLNFCKLFEKNKV